MPRVGAGGTMINKDSLYPQESCTANSITGPHIIRHKQHTAIQNIWRERSWHESSTVNTVRNTETTFQHTIAALAVLSLFCRQITLHYCIGTDNECKKERIITVTSCWLQKRVKSLRSNNAPAKCFNYNALPPWQQNIFSSRMAATGKQLKQSVKVFHSLILYLLLPAVSNIRCALNTTTCKRKWQGWE